MEMLKGPRAIEAGIVYLQDEKHEFRTKANGKLWTVYGSPVCFNIYTYLYAQRPFQWSPEFFNWAFNYKRETGEGTFPSFLSFTTPFTKCSLSLALVSKFPKTDILYTTKHPFFFVALSLMSFHRLTHGPAYRIFDRTNGHDDAGCEALRTRLSDLRPKLHLVGHIHEAHGAYIHAWDTAEPPSVQSGEIVLNDDDKIQNPDLDHTVFVNAANWPSGERVRRDGRGKVKFGGSGFQPVVVDLKD